MNEALIKDIFSDEVFVNSLLECETAEEVKTALKEKNLDLSIDDILCLQKMLAAKASEELQEDELENVAGGFAISATVMAILGVCGATASVGGFVNTVTNRRWYTNKNLDLPDFQRHLKVFSSQPGTFSLPAVLFFFQNQYNFAPAGIRSSTISRFSPSLPSTRWVAEIIIPQESIPIIFLGGRFTIAIKVFPTSSSGS